MSYEILTIIVLLNIAATIVLFRKAVLRPEKPKRKFRNRLWRGKPITPKHEPPPPLKDGMSARNAEQFSRDFEHFANVINWELSDTPWRLQELPKFELSELAPFEPAYGRRFAVFHNQVRVGGIELKPDWEYDTANPEVTVHIKLNWVRLLDYETIRSFLTVIASYVSEYDPDTPGYFHTNLQIDYAMMEVLWETQGIPEHGIEAYPDHGEIEMMFKGSANKYLESR